MASLHLQAPITALLPNLTERCLCSTLPAPTLFGAEILTVHSSVVTNYTADILAPMFFNADPPLFEPVHDLSFCNVTVTYTHPGQHDTINVNLWLPLSTSEEPAAQEKNHPSWNGVLLSLGGGGFSTCLPDIASHTALTQGYAISRTDGGHPPMSLDPSHPDPITKDWALLSPGNVNLYRFQDFASVALNDLSILSKQVVHSFYDVPPRHSYFQGCSTGGRQGLMLAQRYPTAYDGILSGAPAIYFPKLLVMHWFGQMMMSALDYYPKACELEALTRAAIQACDSMDGVEDGIISNEAACGFDPFPVSNPSLRAPIPCTMLYADDVHPITELVNISMSAAHIAYHLWGGAKGSTRRPDWHSVSHSSPLAPWAKTKCFRANNTCEPDPSSLAIDWIQLFLYKDPSLSLADLVKRIDLNELDRLFHQSSQEYGSFIGTDDPNLSAFAAVGGKLLMWHGGADEAIYPGQSDQYYSSVQSFFDAVPVQDSARPKVTDFFRFFVVPGVRHCGGGDGLLPINSLQALRTWVEHGEPPSTLEGESFTRTDDEKLYRNLCMYPQVARFKGKGHDMREKESFECVDSF
jgi:hypothetical protein